MTRPDTAGAARDDDTRFTAGLIADVFYVLERHGYARPEDETRHRAMGRAVAKLFELTESFEGDPMSETDHASVRAECNDECKLTFDAHCHARDSGWFCTRKHGHDGQHVSCGVSRGHALHVWENE